MAAGRHAKPREPRSGTFSLVLLTVLAAAVAASAVFVDDVRWVRAGVVVLAVLVVVPFAVLLGRSRDTRRSLQALLDDRDRDVHQLRQELVVVMQANADLVLEIRQLRAQVEDMVSPVETVPDPVYPSLHLPLVRAAFAEDLPPVPAFDPVQVPAEVPPSIAVDVGSDPTSGRRVLDLTASEIRELRQAAGA
ncbi:MAG: hypothetical protein OEV62_07055 [Actinomycetota bacterium]|nr:hypothetical protein [Actinomycetota bacterium]MDH4353328.1 hypothetical protein [Actinomycetota bacterium]MDH5278332.1 hypothetical protein [Actinomycetota bacterium]